MDESKVRSLLRRHQAEPGADDAEIMATEKRLGFALPDDWRELYREANGVGFWHEGDHPFSLLPLAEVKTVGDALESPGEGPPSIVAVIDLGGDYVGLDLDPSRRSFGKLIDCSHETYPHEMSGICDTLDELVLLIANSQGAEWAWPAAQAYGEDYTDC